MSRAAELLGPEGPLASTLPAYELREGQLQMARAVERAVDEDRVLLCEAGTGTGKTLAYLVPAILSGQTVVVSTATKALQEQIFHKDLPLIRAHLGLDVNAVLVKGLSNYLCLRRYQELLQSPDQGGHEVKRSLPVLESWAQDTGRGEISELSELAESHPIWHQVTSSSDTRLGQRCDHHEACWVTRLKQEAGAAKLLVVNHHLFLADLALRGDHPGGALPPYDAVIVDEAHRLEDVATTFFGAQVSSASIERLLSDCQRTLGLAGLAGASKTLKRAGQLARHLFAALNLLGSGDERITLLPEHWSSQRLDLYHALDDALAAVELGAKDSSSEEAVSQSVGRLRELRDKLATIVRPASHEVSWLERRGHQLTLSSSPVDVGPNLRARLFDASRPVIMTSASLTSNGSFEFLRSRVGLSEPLEAPIDELIVPSSLDHRAQALLYTPTDLPEVGSPAFKEAASARIAELLELTPGGAFVLCTSTRSMTEFATSLTADGGRAVLVQGEAPKNTLLERFRRDGNAVLVATMSFWEGVDVPGSALRLVVLDRLPFSVPTDPLVARRCEALEEEGRSPFGDYSLPRAAITLKQGFGRLLRSSRDEGVVAILDRRICTRSYGRVLLKSLPETKQSRSLEDVADFWRAERW